MTPTIPANPLEGLTGKFGTILVDPPWRFQNSTGKIAPEHKRLKRYDTMKTDEIMALPVGDFAAAQSHLYLWTPNAFISEALCIMEAWGFTYKTNIVWLKVRKDGEPDGRGVGFYFRNVTELVLFGIRGKLRTRQAGRTQVNAICTRKEEHSKKPDEQYGIIEACSPGPYLELFARQKRAGWTSWGNQAETYEDTRPVIRGYNNHVLSATGTNGKHPEAAPAKKRGRPAKKRPEAGLGLFTDED